MTCLVDDFGELLEKVEDALLVPNVCLDGDDLASASGLFACCVDILLGYFDRCFPSAADDHLSKESQRCLERPNFNRAHLCTIDGQGLSEALADASNWSVRGRR